ncbi:hypothetical protein NHX12_012075 [Muraenolepis orangiensis]|uniref:Uncharacterized protein n=1 Tax=Muraenolepis orangiensis TaxID=630683 RepID=A0A9Q0DJ72_9TELE|nr:hypothetical protein NHX12_012075 [Muraenolepis orangiensis]
MVLLMDPSRGSRGHLPLCKSPKAPIEAGQRGEAEPAPGVGSKGLIPPQSRRPSIKPREREEKKRRADMDGADVRAAGGSNSRQVSLSLVTLSVPSTARGPCHPATGSPGLYMLPAQMLPFPFPLGPLRGPPEVLCPDPCVSSAELSC